MSLTQQDLASIKTIMVDSINEAYDTLIGPRFDRLEAKMDGLELRMDKLELRMGALEERMVRLEGRADALESGQKETNRRLAALEVVTTDVQGRLEALENDVKELYHLITHHHHPIVGSSTYEKLSPQQRLTVLENAVEALAKILRPAQSKPAK